MEVMHRGKYFMELVTQAEKITVSLQYSDNYHFLTRWSLMIQFATRFDEQSLKGKTLYLNSEWVSYNSKTKFCEIDEITIVENGEQTRITDLDF